MKGGVALVVKKQVVSDPTPFGVTTLAVVGWWGLVRIGMAIHACPELELDELSPPGRIGVLNVT